ncbi:MAG TPA: TonB-dependent receptor plug domain-containing protein [Candidatus Didemnitutus sp.]|nr:TonB-dependent receptor plug domain-containing protein [Candidatus Didemnitutus sp.]
MNLKLRPALYAGFVATAALSGWPLTASAQVAAQSPETAPVTKKEDEPVKLSPFTVTTDKDKGWSAANEVSGSRVNAAIKDIPIPMQVITSQFISDIGATDLRQSLGYVAGIATRTQNDLENTAGTFGSAYGPGGVNNPEGVTANINDVQMKIRGFITDNTLRDGFLRGSGTDSVNIDRAEVVLGPNALLYGIGNFGGVVNYLTQMPQDIAGGEVTASYGTNDFVRTTLDITGPISTAAHLDYRLAGAWESSETNIDFQKNRHTFVAPTFLWKPTETTQLLIDTEVGQSTQNGYSFRALRAAQGNSATPINNDQLEAVSFYWAPGANPRTSNLGGPDTFNNQQESNVEIKLTQNLLRESEWAPSIDFLAGYNHNSWKAQNRTVNAEITGPIAAGQPGYDLSQTIVTLGAVNGLGGQTVDNGNLLFGTLPNSVVKYGWNRNDQDIVRDQERVELNLHKSLFTDKWYQIDESVLVGYSAIKNDRTTNNWETVNGSYSYKSPNDLSPIVYGKQGNGKPDPAMYQNDLNNIGIGWDTAYYLNSYLKFLKLWGVDDRIILMNGMREDKNDNWSTDTTYNGPGDAGSISATRSKQVLAHSNQNGVMLKITKWLSVYGLRSQGFQPNFGSLHDATTGAPVGASTARSNEIGAKFDFFDGKLSGTISRYSVTKTGYSAAPWFAPTPLGHIKFDPSKPIVYELSGGFNAQGVAGATQIAGIPAGQGAPIQTDPTVIAAWNAAVAAGAITHLSPITNQAFSPTSLYINASNPAGAAYLTAGFNSVFTNGGNWPGWLYQGNSNNDPNINNATLDAGGFGNTSQAAAYQVVDKSRGWDGSVTYTPNDQFQAVLTFSLGASVTRVTSGAYPKYPYPQDQWAVWYFPNGGFGLNGNTLAEAYTNPQDTSTHINTLYPGDDTPKNSVSLLFKYKFPDHSSLKGLSFGVGGNWHSDEVIFSGITHGSGQAETSNGKLLVLTSPSQYTLNAFARYDWKSHGFDQWAQFNVDNLLDDTKLYGLIYQTPITAKVSYGIKF